MLIIALAFVLGAWGLQQMPVLPPMWGMVLILPPAIALYMARYQILQRLWMVVLGLVLGFYWAAWQADMRLADSLPIAAENQEIQLIGVVSSMPQLLERGERFTFDVEQVITPQVHVPRHISLANYRGGFKPFSGQPAPVLSSLPTAVPASAPASTLQPAPPKTTHTMFHAGERWQLWVKLKRPHGVANPCGMDFEAWALERNLRATGYVRQHPQNKRLHAGRWTFNVAVETLREHIRDRMQRVLGASTSTGVLLALAIGDESSISQADWQVFLKTGTNHLMSISGLHITMLSGVVLSLVYAIWVRFPVLVLWLPARKAAVAAGLLTAFAYAMVAGFSVPTQRTVYMLAVLGVALWQNRRVAIGRVLGYCLFVVVLLDPWAVLAPGFWLSFGAVAIMSFAMGARLGRPHWLREAIHTQWAVTLGLLPMLVALFNQVSLISPIANAIAIPLVSLVVVPLTLLGAIFPIDMALHAADTVMQAGMHWLTWGAQWPWSTWQQFAPAGWTLPLAMLGVLCLLLPRGFPLRWMGIVWILPMLTIAPMRPAMGAMKLTVLDVGQGLAVVVQTHRHTLLYDTGPPYSSQTDSGSKVILPYLRGEGVTRLNGMIVSHNDTDHSGGMASVLAQIPVAWLASSLPDNAPALAHQTHMHCLQGQTWVWDNVQFQVLSPTSASYANPDIKDNNRSCVVKVTSRYGSALLTGDIEKETEASLLDSAAPMLAADVITVPHHGSRTSSSVAFVNAVNLQAAVFSVGYLNRFHHPRDDVLARYTSQLAQPYRSDRDGAVTFDFGAPNEGSQDYASHNHIVARPWREEHRRYWQTEMP